MERTRDIVNNALKKYLATTGLRLVLPLEFVQAIREEIASGLTPPPGHMRDEHGNDVRVCGDPKLTKDGAIAFEEGTCWCLFFHVGNDRWEVSECRRSGNPFDYGCWWQVDDCDSESVEIDGVYSTKELAESALAARKEEGTS